MFLTFCRSCVTRANDMRTRNNYRKSRYCLFIKHSYLIFLICYKVSETLVDHEINFLQVQNKILLNLPWKEESLNVQPKDFDNLVKESGFETYVCLYKRLIIVFYKKAFLPCFLLFNHFILPVSEYAH